MTDQSPAPQRPSVLPHAPPADSHGKPRRGRFRLTSPLTRRILAVNVLAPVILVAGLFYLDRYKNELIAADLESLRIRAEMVAAAVGEGAVTDNGVATPALASQLARQMVRRLSQPARVRTRLFEPDGDLMADSRTLLAGTTVIQVDDLPPPERGWFIKMFKRIYDFITASGVTDDDLPLYHEKVRIHASDYPEVTQALTGDPAWAVRTTPQHRLILSTAVPVQHYKQVLGAVMVSTSADDIAESLFHIRLTIFQAFGFALAITVTLSLYLASTIARPIRRLAAAAERVRRGHGRRHTIPHLTRNDEIGDLSEALRDMTETLWRRMDAIEAFAADVAHEIKNPLTSLRSAVETVSRVQNPEQQRKLMAIIQDDVGRLNRLISDISDASRLDAELSRAETESVQIRKMVEALAEVYRDTGAAEGVQFVIETNPSDDLIVQGLESRLVQVLRNLIANALSFSPPNGTITLRTGRDSGAVVITVEDEGPGIPENKLEAIFERFYSERPKEEKFGTHSGLGLSISKQIIEAHGGRLSANNRIGPDGQILGASFVIRLPASQPVAAG